MDVEEYGDKGKTAGVSWRPLQRVRHGTISRFIEASA